MLLGEHVKDSFLELSKWRAGAVARKMKEAGISKRRLKYDGLGTDGAGKRTSIYSGVTQEENNRQQVEEAAIISKRPDVIANRAKQGKAEERAATR